MTKIKFGDPTLIERIKKDDARTQLKTSIMDAIMTADDILLIGEIGLVIGLACKVYCDENPLQNIDQLHDGIWHEMRLTR